MRLSALLVARNEAARLEGCLASLAFADEIVVVLDRSTDASAQIAQAALAVAIGWLIAGGHIAVWHLVAAGVCLGIVTAFEMPAASALVRVPFSGFF
jgi:cellulose synthase/poly-beta-1,6-N-acetylglucosamine synthase-like glycosyltransferase